MQTPEITQSSERYFDGRNRIHARLFRSKSPLIVPCSANGCAEIDSEHPIGAGDLAIVCKGLFNNTDEVALKALLPLLNETGHYKGRERDIFLRESVLLQENKHPNLPVFYGSGEIPLSSTTQIPYFLREYLPRTARQILRMGQLSISEIGRMLHDVASVLVSIKEPITDISLQNVYRREKGEFVLGDLNFVGDKEHSDIDGIELGYQPPEFRDDGPRNTPLEQVYILGAMGHEALRGTPLTKADIELGGKIKFDTVNARPSVIEVLRKALSSNPADRYQSPDEFAEAFNKSIE